VSTTFLRSSPAALIVLLAACGESPIAPAATPGAVAVHAPIAAAAVEKSVEEYVFHLDGLRLGCRVDGGDTEVLVFSGDILEQYRTFQLPGGVNLVQRSSQASDVSAVGERTGETFRVSGRGHGMSISSEDKDRGGYREVLTMVGERTGTRYFIEWHVRIVYNWDSGREIIRERVETNCFI